MLHQGGQYSYGDGMFGVEAMQRPAAGQDHAHAQQRHIMQPRLLTSPPRTIRSSRGSCARSIVKDTFLGSTKGQ